MHNTSKNNDQKNKNIKIFSIIFSFILFVILIVLIVLLSIKLTNRDEQNFNNGSLYEFDYKFEAQELETTEIKNESYSNFQEGELTLTSKDVIEFSNGIIDNVVVTIKFDFGSSYNLKTPNNYDFLFYNLLNFNLKLWNPDITIDFINNESQIKLNTKFIYFGANINQLNNKVFYNTTISINKKINGSIFEKNEKTYELIGTKYNNYSYVNKKQKDYRKNCDNNDIVLQNI